MPSIETFRKQAKLYLRWHRDHHYPVAARIRTVLPRFQHLSDPDVLAASFKLADAQELVAREHGFESWQALKIGLITMPARAAARPASKPVLASIAPELFVTDIKTSCEFFTQKLGFSIVFVYGEPPFYARVKRDRAEINFKCMEHPVIDPELRDRESLLSADMGVETAAEIKALFLEFQSAGVTFFQTLKRMPWGAQNFIVKDPDGNLLLFAGPGK